MVGLLEEDLVVVLNDEEILVFDGCIVRGVVQY